MYATAQAAASDFDASRPSAARMYDFCLKGKDNYAADRRLAEELRRVAPEFPAVVRANRAFLGRAVRFLAGTAGIGQFVEIGCGLPTEENVHEIAWRAGPAGRVAYIDNDPMVVTHAQALLAADSGTTALYGDLREPATFLENDRLRRLIDFDRPVAVLLTAVLHHVADDEDPYGLVQRIRTALAPGSYLVISHLERTSRLVRAALLHQRADVPLAPRSAGQITRLFDGLTLVAPGLVDAYSWRPDPGPQRSRRLPLLAGVGRVGQDRR